MNELKPCPFCGATNTDQIEFGSVVDDEGQGTEVACRVCNIHGPVGANENEARENWNRRSVDASTIRAAALEEAAKLCDEHARALSESDDDDVDECLAAQEAACWLAKSIRRLAKKED